MRNSLKISLKIMTLYLKIINYLNLHLTNLEMTKYDLDPQRDEKRSQK